MNSKTEVSKKLLRKIASVEDARIPPEKIFAVYDRMLPVLAEVKKLAQGFSNFNYSVRAGESLKDSLRFS